MYHPCGQLVRVFAEDTQAGQYSNQNIKNINAFDFIGRIEIMYVLDILHFKWAHLGVVGQIIQLQVRIEFIAHIDVALQSLHDAHFLIEIIQAIHNGDVRKIQVQW